MAFVNVNGQKLFYNLHGNGVPLVLVSGFTVDHTVWDPVIQDLSKSFSTLTFDNRGVGRSSSPDHPYSISMMAEDTASIIQEIFGKPVNIIGHSMGGAIVQSIAHQYPSLINKAIIANSFPSLRQLFRLVCNYKLELYELGLDPAVIERCTIPWAFSNQYLTMNDLFQQKIGDKENNKLFQSKEGYRSQLQALLDFNSLEWLSEIRVPVKILAGDQDIIATVDDSKTLKNGITTSDLHIMKGVGHVCHVENPQGFVELVKEFFLA